MTRKSHPSPSKNNTPKPASDDNGNDARMTYAVLIRLIKEHQILFEQQKRDNGVRPWTTTAKIAAELETSERTVSKDLARLRDDFGMPVDYVEKRKGVGYTEKVTSLPTQIYTRGESMALCVAMLGMSIHKGTPYAAAARSIAKKLTAGLRNELAVEFEALEKAVTFHCIGADAFIPTVNFEVTTPAVIYHQELVTDWRAAIVGRPFVALHGWALNRHYARNSSLDRSCSVPCFTSSAPRFQEWAPLILSRLGLQPSS
jgi:hypothetical protein